MPWTISVGALQMVKGAPGGTHKRLVYFTFKRSRFLENVYYVIKTLEKASVLQGSQL